MHDITQEVCVFMKALKWKPTTKQLAVLTVLLLAVLVIPVLRICLYTTPWYDDYSYGKAVRDFLAEERTVFSAIRGAVYNTKGMWYAWQGTFSSVFFMSLVPLAWGEQYYFLGTAFLVCVLVTSVLVFMKVMCKDVLKADRSSSIVLMGVAAIMALELMHSIRAGLFWYNSGIHYIGMHSFFLIYVACMVKLLTVKKKWQMGLTAGLGSVLALVTSGANFVTALQGGLITFLVLLVGCAMKKKRTGCLVPAAVIYAVGLYMNISAPGNDKRMAFYTNVRMTPLAAIFRSFVEAFRHISIFTDWMMVILCIGLVPVIWQMVKKVPVRFRLPGLVLAASFCFYATGFTPSLYSLGMAGLGRTLNAVKITYQMLFLLNEIYLLGWLSQYLEARGKIKWSGKVHFTYYVACIVAVLVVFATTFHPQGEFTTYGAYYFVHTGEAYNFYQEYLERVNVLKGKGRNIVVKPYQWNPWLIRVGELSEDPEKEENKFIAAWYGKESVTCKAEE